MKAPPSIKNNTVRIANPPIYIVFLPIKSTVATVTQYPGTNPNAAIIIYPTAAWYRVL